MYLGNYYRETVYLAELRKAASTASVLAERLEIPQEHSSLETTHNIHGFWKFVSPGTKYMNSQDPKHRIIFMVFGSLPFQEQNI